MSQAYVVDLPEDTLDFWEVVTLPSRLTVTSTFTGDHEDDNGSGTRRFIFEGPPGLYVVALKNGDETHYEEFVLDDTPMEAPGAIGADMISLDTPVLPITHDPDLE